MNTNEIPIETIPEAPPDSAAPDFADKWRRVREDLAVENATGARRLRIGLDLIEIRDALKPLGKWMDALDENDISQSTAWRYMRFAELYLLEPERDRETWLRVKGQLALKSVVGEERERGGEESPTIPRGNSRDVEIPEIPADELKALRAEVDQQRQLADDIVEAGVEVLAEESHPEYAADDAKWRKKLKEVADDVRAVVGEYLKAKLMKRLEAELMKRLLPGSE